MSLSVFVAFWAVSLLFVITPGADWAYAISAGLRGRVVVPAVGGMLIGHLAATLLVAAGIGGLIASNTLAMSLLTIVGAAYLTWLGANLLLRPAQIAVGELHDALSWRHWTIKGACVSGLNPKVFLLFLALLPQFTEPAAQWPVSLQIVALGLIHILSTGIVYLMVGFGSQTLLKTRPDAARLVSRVSGVAMVVVGVGLLGEKICR